MRCIIQIRTFFAISASVILFLTAAAKLIAIFQHRPFIDLRDPVFNSLTTRDTLTVASILELGVAVFVLLKRKDLISMVAVSWLVAVFVTYRILMQAFFASRPCHCLGGILDWTHLPQDVLDALPKVLLLYMGIGSISFLLATNVLKKEIVNS